MSVSEPSDPRGEPPDRRKLIAVVHADMVGYSRLIGWDDVGTLERLRSLRRTLIDPAIAEHGGRIVNTGGDSLLIVFDSVDGAVRSAMKVQQQAPGSAGDQPPDRTIRHQQGMWHMAKLTPTENDIARRLFERAVEMDAMFAAAYVGLSRTDQWAGTVFLTMPLNERYNWL
jgi:class 3 adenylate cyclase